MPPNRGVHVKLMLDQLRRGTRTPHLYRVPRLRRVSFDRFLKTREEPIPDPGTIRELAAARNISQKFADEVVRKIAALRSPAG
jgi:hypothetical protein